MRARAGVLAGVCEAELNLGLIERQEGRAGDARARFVRALRLNQELAAAWVDLGVLELESRDFASARRRFERALQVNPDDVVARRNLAVAWTRLGNLGAAANAWRHLVVTAPRLSEPYGALGELALVQGDARQAATLLTTAVTLEPSWAEAWRLLAVARTRLGDTAGARDAQELCEAAGQPERCAGPAELLR